MAEKYEVIIGLEIHVQLKTKSKLFCWCDNTGETKPPNTTICEICTAQPGTLPIPNQQAIDWAVRAALALNCTVSRHSKFDRKHYFYPDLPKGYQISQYDQPIGQGGHLDIETANGARRIELERLHLEEDSAKLLHEPGQTMTVVDFNRAGTPLIEIVTKPCIASPEEARVFLKELKELMITLNVSDAEMEKGHLRVDANISLRPENDQDLYPKTEIKNINSFRSVERALVFEIERQRALWDKGDPPTELATRGWEETKNATIEQRTKEESADYRYFPEPDIPPLAFDPEYLQKIAAETPELPSARRVRFMTEYGFSAQDAAQIISDHDLSEYAEAVLAELRAWLVADHENMRGLTWPTHKEAFSKLLASWLINRFSKMLIDAEQTPQTSRITPENFAEFIKLIEQGSINANSAQTVLTDMFETGHDPSDIVEAKQLGLITDESELSEVVRQVIEANQEKADQYRAGKIALMKFFIGQVMKATGGRADPEICQRILVEQLDGKSVK